jgi:hypothetical protein
MQRECETSRRNLSQTQRRNMKSWSAVDGIVEQARKLSALMFVAGG